MTDEYAAAIGYVTSSETTGKLLHWQDDAYRTVAHFDSLDLARQVAWLLNRENQHG